MMATDVGGNEVSISWHALDTTEVAQQLNVDVERGLNKAQARTRRANSGENRITEGTRRSLAGMLGSQFADFMILILVAAAVVSGVVGELQDAVVILVIVVLGICVFIFLAGVLRGETVTLMFLTAVNLAVAALPEALPAVVFTVLTFSQLMHVLAIRSERQSILSYGLFSNRLLLLAVLLTVALQFMVIYVPALQRIFHASPLTATELAVCLLVPLIVLIAVEVEKALVR
jgi:magnesium-transporting ATPase (P-type)